MIVLSIVAAIFLFSGILTVSLCVLSSRLSEAEGWDEVIAYEDSSVGMIGRLEGDTAISS
jgi:hypothetical protein